MTLPPPIIIPFPTGPTRCAHCRAVLHEVCAACHRPQPDNDDGWFVLKVFGLVIGGALGFVWVVGTLIAWADPYPLGRKPTLVEVVQSQWTWLVDLFGRVY